MPMSLFVYTSIYVSIAYTTSDTYHMVKKCRYVLQIYIGYVDTCISNVANLYWVPHHLLQNGSQFDYMCCNTCISNVANLYWVPH